MTKGKKYSSVTSFFFISDIRQTVDEFTERPPLQLLLCMYACRFPEGFLLGLTSGLRRHFLPKCWVSACHRLGACTCHRKLFFFSSFPLFISSSDSSLYF